MQYSFKKICINAPFPTTQCGHSCQTIKLTEFHDPLYARVSSFRNENIWIIHYSMDVLAFDLDHREQLQQQLREYYQNDKIHVITSTTHTHYANSVRDPQYVEYLSNLLVENTKQMKYSEVENLSSTYQRFHTNAVGKSRISGYDTGNEFLCLIKFYSNDNNFFTVVYNNCHPTILDAMVPYFSAEYPGYVLKKLEDNYPQTDFTFFQGAAGDISSRFIRSGQDYDALMELGDKLFDEIVALNNQKVEKVPVELRYREIEIQFDHEFTPIDLSNIRGDLTERELETIRLGQQERAKLEAKQNEIFGSLIDKARVSAVSLGSVKVIFFPNEIFSEYINYIDVDKEMLVSYSNGYGPYVLPINFPYITYEMFTDTLTKQSKERIIYTLKNI